MNTQIGFMARWQMEKSIELLTLEMKMEALLLREPKAIKRGGIALKQHMATKRNLKKKIKNLMYK